MGIVGNDTEAGICGVLLHYSSQGHLRSRGHGIGFVKYDELKCCKGGILSSLRSGGKYLFRAAEGFNLFSMGQSKPFGFRGRIVI